MGKCKKRKIKTLTISLYSRKRQHVEQKKQKSMKDNLLYYSTNTKLAYILNERFYSSNHFVWCSPVFDPEKLDAYDYRKRIPVSSSPYKIYKNLIDDIISLDMHSSKIEQNRNSLKKGAAIMLDKGFIDTDDFTRIIRIIDKATFQDFSPVIYLIPKELVKDKIQLVEIDSAANPMSTEFQIEGLSNTEFELIEI